MLPPSCSSPNAPGWSQDRCHRIGQTREVHIYRLVSSATIEENILAKSDQKRQLDWLAIQSGGFNTDMLKKVSHCSSEQPEGGQR
jgi:SNF2 family DNA or RNA helicase